jgi:hypothetical protein
MARLPHNLLAPALRRADGPVWLPGIFGQTMYLGWKLVGS